MNIGYSEILFSPKSFHVETSQFVCFENHLIGFFVIWGFSKACFWTEHKSTIINLMSMTYFSIIYLIIVTDTEVDTAFERS